jgi:tetratricopeptide (TPR) repeat protein
MESVDRPAFLDVPTLLEASQPRRRTPLIHFLISGFVSAIVLSWVINHSGNSQAQQMLEPLIALGLILLIGTITLLAFITVRRVRAEQAAVAAVDELVQLRRFPEAGLMLQAILSQPARSPVARAQSLLYLAMVLARYHRFEDSVAVYEYLLNEMPLDDATEHGVKLGRAMSMLREENLLDADRAIADLRRTSRGVESAGLALVEIYRDVKTGHPAEAIEMFNSRLPAMRRQLGHRIADAWALVARAYDQQNRGDDAKRAFENATLLAPLPELLRRYPELGVMAEKYRPATAPMEVA